MGKPAKPHGRDPILLEVCAAIGAGRIGLKTIESTEEEYIHGCTNGDGSIVINPAIEVCDTTIHECLHRLRPQWSELAVRRRTRRIMGTLSDREIEKIFELVMVSVNQRKRRAHVRTA